MLCSRLQVGIYAEEDKGSLHVQHVTEALKADGAEKSWGEFQRVKPSDREIHQQQNPDTDMAFHYTGWGIGIFN